MITLPAEVQHSLKPPCSWGPNPTVMSANVAALHAKLDRHIGFVDKDPFARADHRLTHCNQNVR